MGAEQSTAVDLGAEQISPANQGCGDAAAGARPEGLLVAPPAAPPAPVVGAPAGGTDQANLELLTHVMRQLGQRENHTLLLSDLGALLPQDLRNQVKERGGLRSALQRFAQLFSVTGSPGKESVSLNFNMNGAPAPVTASTASGTMTTTSTSAARIAAAAGNTVRDEDEDTDSALQLRGLPYRATMQDVRAFLGRHARNLKDDASGQSIHLVMNRDGRPSGFAKVQLNSPQSARVARDELNNKMMEVAHGDAASKAAATKANRYVEVFLFSERPNKLRFKKEKALDASEQYSELGVCDITAEQVYGECCAYMATPGRGQLLLSMLGVALSPAARNYLKRTDQGLKQFLLQHPSVLAVDGAKGRESITYLPTMPAPMPAQYNDPYYDDSHSNIAGFLQDAQWAFQLQQQQQLQLQQPERAHAPESGSINDLQAQQQPPELAHVVERGSIGDLQQAREQRLLASPKPAKPRPFGTPVRGTPGQSEAASKWYEKTPSIWGDSPAVVPGTMGAHMWQPPVLPPELLAAADAAAANPQAGMLGGTFEGLDPSMLGLPFAPWLLPQHAGGVPPHDCGFAGPGGHLQAPPAPWAAAGLGMQASPEIVQALNDHLAFHDLLGKMGAGPEAAPAELAEPAGRVKLRGLPFDSTDQDVYCFFSKYDVVDHIHSGPDPVQLLAKPNGRKSGIAMVRLNTLSEARKVRDVLQGKMMGTRYIEVFLAAEGEEEKAEKSGKQASKADKGGSAAVPAFTKQQQPQQQRPRSPALSAPPGSRQARCGSPPRSLAPATATHGMDTPEMQDRVKWSEMNSPSPYPATGDTGGSGGSAHLAPWEKGHVASIAKPFGAFGHPQAAPSAGTGDELFQKSLFASMGEMPAPPPPPEVWNHLGDFAALFGQQGGAASALNPSAPAFSFMAPPPPPQV